MASFYLVTLYFPILNNCSDWILLSVNRNVSFEIDKRTQDSCKPCFVVTLLRCWWWCWSLCSPGRCGLCWFHPSVIPLRWPWAMFFYSLRAWRWIPIRRWWNILRSWQAMPIPFIIRWWELASIWYFPYAVHTRYPERIFRSGSHCC